MSSRVGVQPTPLQGKIDELKTLMGGLEAQGVDGSCFNLSKGPCRDAMVLFDKEFACESHNLLRSLLNATISYLEDSMEVLSPL